MSFKHNLLLTLLIINVLTIYGQEKIIIKGKIVSEQEEPIEKAHIIAIDSSKGTTTNKDGSFELILRAEFPINLQISHIEYLPGQLTIQQKDLDIKPLKIVLQTRIRELNEVKISEPKANDQSAIKINADLTPYLSSPAGPAIEGLIRSQMGVAANNELSSQYRVRGGNFDENLVYLNGFEIFRPQLIRSGQQEGLSIINPDLTESVYFSAGGFSATYGDKMSSALDVQYKKPQNNESGINVSLLGANIFTIGSAFSKKITWLAGARYKTNRYLLNSLDTKGDYNPEFTDFQTNINYQINSKFSIEALGYYALNQYNFIPSDRETSFGTINDIKQLKIYFAGQEKDRFKTGMGALRLNFQPDKSARYELQTTHYRALENEAYDIAGAYWLQEIEGTNDAETTTTIGVGEYLQHARNDLLATVTTVSLKGINHINSTNSIQWGLKWQKEYFDDRINEWEMIDSAGYSIPRNSNLELSYSLNTQHQQTTHHLKLFVAHQTTLTPTWGKISMNYGTRVIWYDNESTVHVTPRFQFSFHPHATPNTRFRLSGGWYFQPPFYKEYRPARSGEIYSLESQKSRQILTGIDHYFSITDRPFKFSAEVYYKYLYNLIPYQVDNVRIIYSGKNEAKGYATGADFKIHGEFVPGSESWATLSLLRTEEDILTDTWEKEGEPGYIPRPSDQRVNFSMFFQDYLPNNPSFKVHLSFYYGSGLTFGPPRSPRYMATFRMPPYRRVDIGFSKDLLPWMSRNLQIYFLKTAWLSAEIFNLFDINNTISYFWVSDVNNREYAVPNYLTGRRLNISLKIGF
ncbi:TonB-dependent receptor [Thermophagus xiamenensis]|uniref:Outer membrane receptor proteins, mostly Fe transport n=1 Tax=Thermophagus xiamenensis TaxID=385682 RepID=A0A1I2BRE4_9BACT|nr:carboxypeptidase-like regulatory domain-containing protein [Thermophagus xiamenensis]SFE58682.1 Outer membrane receptor proteins, mostly Fe transport [Thermophagus xiamenensis]